MKFSAEHLIHGALWSPEEKYNFNGTRYYPLWKHRQHLDVFLKCIMKGTYLIRKQKVIMTKSITWTCAVTKVFNDSVSITVCYLSHFNSSPPGQSSSHFADNIVNCIFINEKFCILIQISLKFVPTGPINNKSVIIGSGNGLAPNRRQAITWTNAGPIQWYIYAALGEDGLNFTHT